MIKACTRRSTRRRGSTHPQVCRLELFPLVHRPVALAHDPRRLALVEGQLPVQRRGALQLLLEALLGAPLGGLHLCKVLSEAVALLGDGGESDAVCGQLLLCTGGGRQRADGLCCR